MRTVLGWLARRHKLYVPAALVLIVTCSVLTTYAMLAISPMPMYVLRSLSDWSHGLMPLLNFLPVLFFMLLMFFITSNAVLSIASVSFVGVVMAIVNSTKLTLRGDPLMHWDFAMIGEVLGVAQGLGGNNIVVVAIAIVLFIGVTVFLIRWLPTQRMHPRTRIISSIGCAAVMLVLNATLYSSTAIEESLPTWGSFYNQADVHNSKGNLYSFLYNWNYARSAQPDGYDAQEAKAFAETYEIAYPAETSATVLPNIIMIMGEALSDISDNPAFDFEGYCDPLENYARLGAEGIRGHIVVPSRGGGTADTEFDALTGRSARFLRNAPYAYRMIVGPTDAIPAVLRDHGYQTFALHPGYTWFYNRQNVYPNLGFTESVFEDSFPAGSYLDTFISEEATYDMLISMIEERTDSDAPMFGFCLTIQNHAAYLNRYLPQGTYNFTPTVSMTDEDRNILSNYFEGTIDADRELGRLTDYLNTLSEPYVVISFGDHLPALDEELYELIIPGADTREGTFTHETRLYSTPFLIWQNEAAREQNVLDLEAARALLPENATISSNYLGAYALELLGLDTLSPYLRYTNEIRTRYPVIMGHTRFDPNGQKVAEGDDLKEYIYWMHYKMTEE